MEKNLGKNKINVLNEAMKYLGALMALLYVVAGIAIVTGPNSFFSIPSVYAFPMGSMLIVYGLFRAYRIYQKTKH